jgi:hypothetical protein
MAESERDLLVYVCRAIVEEIAPGEASLVKAQVEQFLEHPEPGFAATEATQLITPHLVPVVFSVLSFLRDEVIEATKAEAGSAVGSMIRRMFRPLSRSDERQPRLTLEQLAQVHRVAYEKATSLDLPEARAALLADAVAGSLVA